MSADSFRDAIIANLESSPLSVADLLLGVVSAFVLTAITLALIPSKPAEPRSQRDKE
jgi:hypothetical protein